MSDSIRTAFRNGVEDRTAHGLHRYEQLYRSGAAQRFAWRLGWEVANLLTSRPLRSKGRRNV